MSRFYQHACVQACTVADATTDDPVQDEVAVGNITLTAFDPDRLDRNSRCFLDPYPARARTRDLVYWPRMSADTRH